MINWQKIYIKKINSLFLNSLKPRLKHQMINQSDFPIEFSKKKSFLLHIWRINIQKLIPDLWFEYDPFFKISMNFKKTNNYSPNKKIDLF